MTEQATSRHGTSDGRPVSGLAVGLTTFAAVLMIMAGFFNALQGLVALLDDELYLATPNYLVQLDTTTWGWIHLLVGALVVFAGFAVLSGKVWARTIGVILAVVSALANFAFVPYYPFWSLTIIALDVFIIWALTMHGRDITRYP